MPVGWNHGQLESTTRIRCGSILGEATAFLEKLLAGEVDEFCEWMNSRRKDNFRPFEKAALEADLEFLMDSFPGGRADEGRLSTL